MNECSQQHCSQQPKGGNNPYVNQQMNGYTKYDIFTEWNIIQP